MQLALVCRVLQPSHHHVLMLMTHQVRWASVLRDILWTYKNKLDIAIEWRPLYILVRDVALGPVQAYTGL